ncbi:DUF4350 domain-containing protein [Actinomadura xylanilytica]|uniref:DUF4350 domain-containing protein n=1 Tax=Actinomadura xylanilytica TaxID=887459 RepID=UPI00255A93BC|nr:DUF4350 domain-containing protein [Actinomadura xylanilytica]MDL4776017.1 DUF4350 domain-containing protein [Actinomadura xylanilytica]
MIQSPPQGGADGSGSPAPPGPTAGQVASRRFRSARGIVLVLLALVAIAVILAALRPSVTPQDLDPTSPTEGGSRALAEILKQNGTRLDVARRAGDAAGLASPGSVTVVTRPERLTDGDIDRLRGAQGDLLLVQPNRSVLRELAPGVHRAGTSFERTADLDCALPAARLAGPVAFGGAETYATSGGDGVVTCYRADDYSRLVQVRDGSRTVTVLGSPEPLTNAHLTEEGNAALGMNLAGARSSVVWLIPDLPEAGAGGDATLSDLLPFGVKLFVLEVLVAVALVALWRARRLGPVVAEALPVVVRSAETVEGRARLYRAHHARGRAADALRAGARERLVPLLGLPRSTAQDFAFAQEIVTGVAHRTSYDEAVVGTALYGPEPADDAQLLALTDILDVLERQVRQS